MISKVAFLLLMREFRQRLVVAIEQPLSSWMFKMPKFGQALAAWGTRLCLTYQGFYGHDLLKGTHLQTNMNEEATSHLAKRASKKEKEKHKRRIQRKHARQLRSGKALKSYYKKLPHGKFQGDKHLSESAIYPKRFCKALLQAWLHHNRGVQPIVGDPVV